MKEVVFERLNEQSYQIKESLRQIRTNIRFCGSNVKTILFTSTEPDEGKTSVAFELARSFAGSGKKVLLIDTDMRKSVLATKLAARSTDNTSLNGLSMYLSDIKSFEETICYTNIPNLRIIFAGPSVPNATELLEKERFTKLLFAAKKYFDYIIIDSAPITAAIDSSIIASKCDGTVLVIAQNQVNTRVIQRAIKQLKTSNAKIIGTILNKVKRDTSYYGRYYGKYYGSYYGEQANEEANE